MDRYIADALVHKAGTAEDEAAARYYRAVAEALPHMVWITTADGNTEYVNQRTLDFSGLTMEGMAGLNWLDTVHPDDRAGTLAVVRDARETGLPYEAEHRALRHDGVYLWHMVRGAPVVGPDGKVLKWIGTSTNIEDRKRAEHELAETTAQLELLFDCAPVGICFLDHDLRYVQVNEALAEMNGVPREDHIGRHLSEVIPEVADASIGFLTRVLELGEPVLDVELTGETAAYPGDPHTVLASYFPLPGPGGKARGVGVVVIDITARRRLEAQFLQAQKLEVLGRLTSAIAHDFNNLLTAIGGFGHLALRHVERGEDPSGEIREVLAAADRSAVLVRQVLTFTSAEREEVGTVNPNEQLRALRRLLQVLAGERVRLELDLAPGLPVAIGNAGAFEQIVMNLTANARDAMPDGGPLSVSTATRKVDAAAAAELGVEPGRFVVLRVVDAGSGMSESVRSQAFQPFFTTKDRSKGSGLGLSTVQGLVHRFSGSVTLESVPDVGTTVTVLLPVAAQATEAAPVDDVPRGDETILLAEDVEAVRKLLESILTEAGYRVLAAESGEAALAFAESEPFALLLSDIVMPGISGTELAGRLRARDPSLPVLLMSGYAEEDIGDYEFMLKPFDTFALVRRIRALLDAAE